MNEPLHHKLEALPVPQQELWPALRVASELGFVLYGGTAIALRLGHRISVDFDLFSHRPLDQTDLTWVDKLPVDKRVLWRRKDTLIYSFSTAISDLEPVKVSFFGSLDFGRIGNPQLTSDNVMYVASLEDLLATKLKVMLQRAETKDYLDVIALLNAGVSLETGLAGAKALFGDAFQPMEAHKALTFFEDGDLSKLTISQRQVLLAAAAKVPEGLPPVSKLSTALVGP